MISSVDADTTLDPDLADALRTVAPDKEFPVIVTLADKANIADIRETNRSRQRERIIAHLRTKAENSQKSVRAFLYTNNAKRVHPFWINNSIAVTANTAIIKKLAAMPGIESIRIDQTFHAPTTAYIPAADSWNLPAINALEMWSLGFTGQGVLVATLDTGVDGQHPDLAGRWRGGSNSWFDPHDQHTTPYDAAGHGTGVMGLIIASHSDGSAIGIAPDAQWIAGKLFNDAGSANFSDIHACFEWVLDPDGNPNTDDTPDVVNNSWGFKNNVNQCISDFEEDIEALQAAGITVVFAAGNTGPNQSTSISPANYVISFSVGMIDENLIIDSASARGPSACDSAIYPKVVAPGAGVQTCDLYGGYATVWGTSFASPHVSGSLALLRSAFPARPAAHLEWALMNSTRDLGTPGPDNIYGNGLINTAAAYRLLLCDISADGHIDYLDFALFADKWLTADPQSDLNSYDPINMADFAILASYWKK
ncbi:MAG: hypothetical protein A2Y07_09025 [Planctomycetes bacterium GWF2_50_10]|nr:MAG: hypothetical protein A2Y07_09025 [Planctomycetes bacterium GWF2_50_10]